MSKNNIKLAGYGDLPIMGPRIDRVARLQDAGAENPKDVPAGISLGTPRHFSRRR